MKKVHYILSFLIMTILISACEKVIELPLDEGSQRVVIDAKLNDRPGESSVLLSMTGDTYGGNDFVKISDANVVVTDKDGIPFVFNEDLTTPGRYMAPGFVTEANNLYTLEISIEGEDYSATSETFSKTFIDSLTYLSQIGGFGPQDGDTSFLVFYNFLDNVNEDNYYRMILWVNEKKDDNFYILNDQLNNGQPASAPFFASAPSSGDTVFVELQSMDEANYTYLFTLANNADTGPFSAAPANPVSNIEGDAIGYFGAFITDTLTLILP